MVDQPENCPLCGLAALQTCDSRPGLPMTGPFVCPQFERAYNRAKYRNRWPVPAKYASADLDRRPDKVHPATLAAVELAAVQIASEWGRCYNGRVGNIILANPENGIGKTYLAAAALNRAGQHLAMTTAWVDAHGLIERFKATFDESSEETAFDIERELLAVDLLAIDDVGKQRGTEYSDAALWSLFNARYLVCKPVIVTTNLTASELNRTPTWSAIIDRLMESATVIRLEGAKSIRREMGKARLACSPAAMEGEG